MKCVQCGYCCKVAICPFGEWDGSRHRCRFLTATNLCSRYDEIKATPSSEFSPAFGAGCSSSLFNMTRENKIKEMEGRA